MYRGIRLFALAVVGNAGKFDYAWKLGYILAYFPIQLAYDLFSFLLLYSASTR